MKKVRPKIYWANSMFSVADREFNIKCARILRQAGYDVYLPQEAAVNKEVSPSAKDIFRIDTTEILSSDILVACIDQETIDSGVACEIGIAFAYGVPVIGLYTDIRQYRQGAGRMYKNPYVIGAIESLGRIVSNMDELLQTIPEYLSMKSERSGENAIRHFNDIAPSYSEYIQRLESWYDPHWNVEHILIPWLQEVAPARIIEFGCGTGSLARGILQQHPNLIYFGYDPSEKMVRIANSKNCSPYCIFTTSWTSIEMEAEKEPFDIAIAAFVFHDHPHPHRAIAEISRILRKDGLLFVIDLSTWDLPNLTDLLRKKLARPAVFPDARLTPWSLGKWAEKAGFSIVECDLTTFSVRFPNKEAILQYLTIFGIHKGLDLPLALQFTDSSTTLRLIEELLNDVIYPFIDKRAFWACILQKDGETVKR